MDFTGSSPVGRCTTGGAAELQLTALTRLGAARDELNAVLEGRLDASPAALDSIASLVARAALEMRGARG